MQISQGLPQVYRFGRLGQDPGSKSDYQIGAGSCLLHKSQGIFIQGIHNPDFWNPWVDIYSTITQKLLFPVLAKVTVNAHLLDQSPHPQHSWLLTSFYLSHRTLSLSVTLQPPMSP